MKTLYLLSLVFTILIISCKKDSNVIMVPAEFPHYNYQVYIHADIASPHEAVHFQDFYMSDSSLYFHPTGPNGIYKYNFVENQTEILEYYSSGDCIAHDSSFIFYDIGTLDLYRYNIKLDSTDLKINISMPAGSWITGLDCHQGKLYVLVRSAPHSFMAIFDYDGIYLSSIPFPRETWFLTISDNIAYSHDLERNLVSFDLITKTFLNDKIMPIDNCEGIRVYNDKFYFADWDERFIGILPLADLKEVE